MMEKFKIVLSSMGGEVMKGKELGITMIQMVITVLMMIIIAGFSVYNANDTIIESRIAKAYNEMMEVKNAVIGLKTLGAYDMRDIGTQIPNLSSYNQLMPYYTSGDHEYYLLDFEGKGDAISEILEIRNIENNYIVDVGNIENVEIFLINGVKIGGVLYYSDDEILEKYNDIFAGR